MQDYWWKCLWWDTSWNTANLEMKKFACRQKVKYEWLPLKCSHCKMFGHAQENYRKQDTHRKEWRVRSQVQPQEQHQPSERAEPGEDEDLQLVTRHTTRHYVARAEGQREIITLNELLKASTYNVLLEEGRNQAEGGEGRSYLQMDKIISWNVRGMNGHN